MKKPARRGRAKAAAKGTKAKSKASASRAMRKSKGRASTQAKTSAGRTSSKSRPKLKHVAKKAAKAAVVAAGVAAVGTAFSELVAPAEPDPNSGQQAPAERGADESGRLGEPAGQDHQAL
jgi:hypothetical protein